MSKLKRREFLAGGALAAVGLTCFSKDIRAAIQQARTSGKPLFTENSLNSFIKANSLRTAKGQELGKEAVRDLGSFINKHFYLTEAQSRELASITEADKKKLIDALRKARERKGTINVRIASARASDTTRPLFAEAAYHPAPTIKSIDIVFGRDGLGNFFIGIEITKEE